jgi:hypothetical protein
MLKARLDRLEKAIGERPCEVARTMKRVHVIDEGEPLPPEPPVCRCAKPHHRKLIVTSKEGATC